MRRCSAHLTQILTLMVAWPAVGNAADYFVATTGNDSSSGTVAAPFRTLEHGASVLSPGDTLYVRGGTYQRTQEFWRPPSGRSWQEAVTISNYGNEEVVVTVPPKHPDTQYPFSVFSFNNIQYVVMNGLTLEGTGALHGWVLELEFNASFEPATVR
ncbi:MAG: hypothetical protein R3C68_01685 [Myxococcota bacterium]